MLAPAGPPALNGPFPDMDQQGPQDADTPRASGSDLTSLRRLPIVLAIGTFAIGTDAFVIGGVLPAVARSLGVSTSSAGLLVTAFAIAYAIGGPVLAVGTARLPRRPLLVSALALFVAANILAAVAPGYVLMPMARVFAALGAAAFVPAHPPSPVHSRRPNIAAGRSVPSLPG
jgi:cyanate permease